MKKQNSVNTAHHHSIPPLTENQKAELAALAKKDDHDIDYGDAPSLDDEVWANASQGRFYKPVKI